jgi:putative tricarboxylic transport membrane protein
MAGKSIQGLLWLCLGITISYLSTKYKVGTLDEPGPGVLPFICGLLFILFALILLVRTQRAKGSEREKPLVFGPRYRKVLLIMLFMAAVTFFMETLGYLVSVFLLIIVPMFLLEPKRWVSILLLGVISSFLSYLLFDFYLGIPLPKGLFSLRG